jgi:hypothetical protein
MSFITTPQDLAKRFRSDVNDPLRGPVSKPDVDALWKIEDVEYYMSVAASKVGREGEQLFNTITLAMTAFEPTVTLPKNSLYMGDIRRAYLQTTRRELTETNIENLKNYRRDYGEIVGSGGWEIMKGYPRWFIRNYYPGQLRLVPIPAISDTLELTAMFVPRLQDGMPLPFEDPIDIELMLTWMKVMAYRKHDVDTFDEDRALKLEEQFRRDIVNRNSEARRIRRAPTRTIFQW